MRKGRHYRIGGGTFGLKRAQALNGGADCDDDCRQQKILKKIRKLLKKLGKA